MYKNILIPTDGSALSRAAAKMGIKLAKSSGARVGAIEKMVTSASVKYKSVHVTDDFSTAAILKAAFKKNAT
jgi:nucleotide-binding universal stress UspA family protein